MTVAGRRKFFNTNCSKSFSSTSGRRSLACNIPFTSSISSPTTGNREWRLSTTIGSNCSIDCSSLITTKEERWIMISLALSSDTCTAPKMILRTSSSIRLRLAAARRILTSSGMPSGSSENRSASHPLTPRLEPLFSAEPSVGPDVSLIKQQAS